MGEQGHGEKSGLISLKGENVAKDDTRISAFGRRPALRMSSPKLVSPKPTPTRVNPANVFFKDQLNMPQAPDGISDFSGSGMDLFPAFLNNGSYHYKVDQKAFNEIISWDKFFDADMGNSPFHEIQCTDLPEWAATWSDSKIDLEGKDCNTGTFAPNLHYLVLDPVTGDVNHSYTGTRE